MVNIGMQRHEDALAGDHCCLFSNWKFQSCFEISCFCFKGITLTAADHIIFSELHWTPGVMQQAEDRVHRIGQENSVLVQYLVARGTIDEVLWRMLCNKVDVLELDLQKVGSSFLRSSLESSNFTPLIYSISNFIKCQLTCNNCVSDRTAKIPRYVLLKYLTVLIFSHAQKIY